MRNCVIGVQRRHIWTAFLSLAIAMAFVAKPQMAMAQSRGVIAGSIIGGIAAAVIASQIAKGAQAPAARPRAARTVKQKPKHRDSAVAAVSRDNNSDPFAGVTPTATTRVNNR